MDISSVRMNGLGGSVSVREPAPVASVLPSQPAHAKGGTGDVTPEQVKEIVADMQKQLDSMNVSLQYTFYGEHDKNIAVKVVNKDTGEVIREIPAKEIQTLKAKMSELVGMIFNSRG